VKNRLLVISASDFGREVAWLAKSIPEKDRDWEFGGFLDNRPAILDGYPNAGEILGDVESYAIQPQDRFVCAIGFPKPRLEYARKIEARGGQFVNLIHPLAVIGERTLLGSGVIVFHFAFLTTDIQIGSHAVLMPGAIIGHNARVDDGAVISAGSFMGGYSKVGECAFLGPHAVVLPKKTIGAGATLGAGSVALRNVKDKQTAFGVPATEI
jgi:sugar O-acyltransferase (sialic acid O-acetyltransferase NeuD family)